MFYLLSLSGVIFQIEKRKLNIFHIFMSMVKDVLLYHFSKLIQIRGVKMVRANSSTTEMKLDKYLIVFLTK